MHQQLDIIRLKLNQSQYISATPHPVALFYYPDFYAQYQKLIMSEQNLHLLFVYNAKSGFWNGALDSAHKVVSPDTYACQLCSITFGLFGMRKKWSVFLDELKNDGITIGFAHKDDSLPVDVELPAVLSKTGENYNLFISAEELKEVPDVQAMIQLVKDKLA